jgi:N-acetylglucosaminyl-diphospho-decaprenol L-rhamnosyltransferase
MDTRTEVNKASAVIVHYRAVDHTVASARAVAQTAPGAEILVVDSASGDAIAERLAAEVPQARLFVQPSNRGYGAGCNRGARETSRPHLLFLNSDAFVTPGAIEALVAALDADRGAAAAGPRLVNADGSLQPSIRRLPTPWRIFCESSGLAALARGRGFLRGHTRTREDHERRGHVPALRGAALLVRRSDFEEVGGFDESFFLYAEETDLLARLSARGRGILFEPKARVTHLGGVSAGDAYFGELHAGLRHYVEKHHGRAAARAAGLFLFLGAAARWLVALVTPGMAGRRRRLRYHAALFRGASPR